MNDSNQSGAERKLYLKRFGAEVRRARIENTELSQERLASEIGLHRTEIGKIENGEVEPKLRTLVILANGLGTTLDELVRDLGVPVRHRP